AGAHHCPNLYRHGSSPAIKDSKEEVLAKEPQDITHPVRHSASGCSWTTETQGCRDAAMSPRCGVPPAQVPEEFVSSASVMVRTQTFCFCSMTWLVAGSVTPVETMRMI